MLLEADQKHYQMQVYTGVQYKSNLGIVTSQYCLHVACHCYFHAQLQRSRVKMTMDIMLILHSFRHYPCLGTHLNEPIEGNMLTECSYTHLRSQLAIIHLIHCILFCIHCILFCIDGIFYQRRFGMFFIFSIIHENAVFRL